MVFAPKVMLVCGSPRAGNSESVSRRLAGILKEKGALVDLVLLREKNILPWHEGHEKAKDDMPALLEKFKNADAYVIVSPSYYGMPPGILKNFIDRTDVLFGSQEKFKDRAASVVSIGASPLGGGIEHNGENLRLFFRMIGARNMDCLYLKGNPEPKKDEILKEKDVIERLPMLAENLLLAAKKLRGQ
ncbi:MAG: NAD(P)H-dependent oxidoreductase [Candidatus Diapherotrites archaeon]|nr:NAD(P)H-dependent oxidoreductase [Candidatus Diapherotrites archaeon]